MEVISTIKMCQRLNSIQLLGKARLTHGNPHSLNDYLLICLVITEFWRLPQYSKGQEGAGDAGARKCLLERPPLTR